MERGRVIVVYQPHTYTRTHDLFDGFISSFNDCDLVIFADIYAAREKNLCGISSKNLADATENGIYVGDFEDISNYLKQNLREDDLLIIMGAGDIINLKI
jgi:UDP-N-acetylmuramate--alanine ligase